MTTRWRSDARPWLGAVRPYLEAAPLAALFLGISSGFAFAMIGATLTTRLAQHGITKSAVTAFALTFLAYNLKFLWAPIVDNVRLPLHRPLRAAAQLAVADRRAGDGGGRLSRPRRSRARRSTRSRSRRSRWASPAPPSTSSSTPTASSCSSRASSASAPACRNTAGGSAPRQPARWRWSSPRASAGRPPISPAPPSRCRRCWSAW